MPTLHAIERIRAVFEAAAYSEPSVCRRLETSEIPSHRQRRQLQPLYHWRTRNEQILDILVRLFLLRQSVPCATAERALAPLPLADWAKAGILEIGATDALAAVEVIPFQSLLLAADWLDAVEQPVMGVAATTRALAQLTIRDRKTRVLDLGAGCGVQALLAAAHAERVCAVDFNPRALEILRFNAALNRIDNIERLHGDWFTPVAGQAFDLIVCNPPFVIGPAHRHLHTSNDRAIDELCRDLVRQAPAFLTPGGYCQVLCNWAHVAGQDSAERLGRWIEGSGCDACVLVARTENAATYAQGRVSERTDNPELAERMFAEWMAYLEEHRVEAIGFGVINLRKPTVVNQGRWPTWFRFEPLPALIGAGGSAIERRFHAWDFLRANADDSALLKVRLRAADHLHWEQSHTCSGAGWSATRSQLSLAEGIAFAGNAAPEVARFVADCRGERTLGEQVRKLAAAAGQETNRFAPGMLKVVRRLIELGFLLPVQD